MKYIDSMIRLIVFEIKINKELTNLIIPNPRFLLPTIQRFLELTSKSKIFHKSNRLLHIYLLSEVTMEKGTFNIQQVNLPTKVSSEGNK